MLGAPKDKRLCWAWVPIELGIVTKMLGLSTNWAGIVGKKMLGEPKQKRLPPSLDRQLVVLYQRLEQVETLIKLFLTAGAGGNFYQTCSFSDLCQLRWKPFLTFLSTQVQWSLLCQQRRVGRLVEQQRRRLEEQDRLIAHLSHRQWHRTIAIVSLPSYHIPPCSCHHTIAIMPLPSQHCHQTIANTLLPSCSCHHIIAITQLPSHACHHPIAIASLPSHFCHHKIVPWSIGPLVHWSICPLVHRLNVKCQMPQVNKV